jgi:tetratricopeptide (TPR) repeat protein
MARRRRAAIVLLVGVMLGVMSNVVSAMLALPSSLAISIFVVTLIASIWLAVTDGSQQTEDASEQPDRATPELEVLLSSKASAVNNLPSEAELIGGRLIAREEDLTKLENAVSNSQLTSIEGMGGIGKTSLALAFAHYCLDHTSNRGMPSFRGIVWVSAQDREIALSDIVTTILQTLGTGKELRGTFEDQRNSATRILKAQPCLLIVDNFDTISDRSVATFLKRLPKPSRAILTSRRKLTFPTWRVPLEPLGPTAALALIRAEARQQALISLENASERSLLPLYKATAGLPLAIRIAIGQITRQGQSLEHVISALLDAKGPLFDKLYSHSWYLLHHRARNVLMALSVFADSATESSLKAASNENDENFDEALGQLVEQSLVDASDLFDEVARRYSIHPLTRAFALKQIKKDDGLEKTVRLRLAHFYLDFALAHGRENDATGYDLLERERVNIFSIVGWCDESQEWLLEAQLMQAITFFMGVRGYWNERLQYGLRAIQAARKATDNSVLAWLLTHTVSWIYLRRGQFDLASSLLYEAQNIYEQNQDNEGCSFTKRFLGHIAQAKGDLPQAEQLYLEALQYIEGGKDITPGNSFFRRGSVAATLKGELAALALSQNRLQDAQKMYSEAIAEANQADDVRRAADLQIQLANLCSTQPDLEEQAQGLYEAALVACQAMGRIENVARCNLGLASLAHRTGAYELGLERASDAKRTFEQLGMKPELQSSQEIIELLTMDLQATAK